jgi:hypothetical protein
MAWPLEPSDRTASAKAPTEVSDQPMIGNEPESVR